MESTCTAVYISPNKCSYAGENVYSKVLAFEEQITISGGTMVRIPQKLCLGILMSWFFSLGISMSWDIAFLWNSDPYAPWYHNIIKIFHNSRLFLVLYLLVNTVIAMAITRKSVEHISFLIQFFSCFGEQVSITLIKTNII